MLLFVDVMGVQRALGTGLERREATRALASCRSLLDAFHQDLSGRAVGAGADSVAIITPYVDQARAIRARLKEQAGDQGDGRQIECSTVHRFQGQERDVVILDTVDAEPMKPGVLLSESGAHSMAQNLINVAISRARGKLIVVADVGYFERRAAGSVVTRMVTRALGVGRREILRK